MIELQNISKTLGDFSLRDINLNVAKGEYHVILGASGVGKTVLLECITGMVSLDDGKLFFNGMDITCLPMQKRNIALVYQEHALFPHLSVFNNIAYPLRIRKKNRAEILSIIKKLADELGITHLLIRAPTTLSGGEAQRVALARALTTKPSCLLLDEPLSSIDIQGRSAMRSILRRINREHGLTIIHVTHDYEEAASLASRISVMENGTIAQTGTPREIFHYPKTEFIARFTGIKNFFTGKLSKNKNGIALFSGENINIQIMTDYGECAGIIIIRSEDITLSNDAQKTSAKNHFLTLVKELIPAGPGTEVILNINEVEELVAIVTNSSVEGLCITEGTQLYATIKASAVKFLPE